MTTIVTYLRVWSYEVGSVRSCSWSWVFFSCHHTSVVGVVVWYYNGKKKKKKKKTLPIQSTKLLSIKELTCVLLDGDLKPESIPFYVNVNSAFIIDLSKLDLPKDILCNNMGTWNWNGSFRKWCSFPAKDWPSNYLLSMEAILLSQM